MERLTILVHTVTQLELPGVFYRHDYKTRGKFLKKYYMTMAQK